MKNIAVALTLPLIVLSLMAGPARADISVTFSEGAPKDRFIIANTSDCELNDLAIVIDLSSSSSGLVFDVTNSGAGVQVFQPFEFVSGGDDVVGQPVVRDGDNTLRLALKRLARGEPVSFTIDVDDTMGGREITVSGSEISGARFDVQLSSASVTGIFDVSAVAVARINSCQA